MSGQGSKKVLRNLKLMKFNFLLQVLKSFHSILIRNKEVEFPEKDRLTSLKAVTFMLENHENVLKVSIMKYHKAWFNGLVYHHILINNYNPRHKVFRRNGDFSIILNIEL